MKKQDKGLHILPVSLYTPFAAEELGMDDLIILAAAASVALWLMQHKQPDHGVDRAPHGLCRTATLYEPDPKWGTCLEADYR